MNQQIQTKSRLIMNQFLIDTDGLMYSHKKMRGAPNPNQIKTAEGWIRVHCHPIKTINRKSYSYDLKHRAERWGSFLNQYFAAEVFSSYVSNGAFIQAALNLGYEPQVVDNSKNACFCMGIK